jgi:hypothetical protein
MHWWWADPLAALALASFLYRKTFQFRQEESRFLESLTDNFFCGN